MLICWEFVAELIDTLKRAVKQPSSVPLEEVLYAVVGIEKARPSALTGDWTSVIKAPGKRWRLVYTAGV